MKNNNNNNNNNTSICKAHIVSIRAESEASHHLLTISSRITTVWLVEWCLTALSGQIGYIVPLVNEI